ncbi:ribonuclease H protein [Pyrus ussuriensis x Pyrus communis]|uniref:Ribonuclease H protein n=1 Tax=Pyrus ussuriensis x Pyrus communis TaxID=2448454 RepID=A0A5N5FB36_9ROSA|nr:ribonuclease H protein [Pyrus ussuriensis x Pyrus communis]
MAEVEAMRSALLAGVEKGFRVVQLETNSKVLVDMLNEVLQLKAVMEGIIWDIHHIKHQLSSIEFLFTPHACNGAAHQVTSYVMRVGGFHMCDCFEPEWLFNSLASDVNISIRI